MSADQQDFLGTNLRSNTSVSGVERSGIGLYSWQPGTRDLFFDDRLVRMFAADRPDEVPYETWVRRVHPDDREPSVATFSTFSKQGALPESVFRIVLDDGSVRHLLSRVTDVVRDEHDDVATVMGVMVDITSAREAEGQLAATLYSISDGFVLLDRDDRFAFVNRQAEVILNSRAADLVGRCVWDAFPDSVGTMFDEAYRQVLQDKMPKRFEEFYPEPLNIWLEVRAEVASSGIVVYFQDISQRRARAEELEQHLKAEQRLRQDADRAWASAEHAKTELAYQAAHDSLTGLVNRAEFARLGQAALDEARTARQEGGGLAPPVVALFVDVDRFKLVNDSLGHAVGDKLLVKVGTRLSDQLRGGDVLARQGGDEFVVLLIDATEDEAQTIAERMRVAAHEPFDAGGHSLNVTLSIGIATAGEDTTIETLLRDADVALYRAKDSGRDDVAWFDAESHQRLLDRVALESDLREALDNGNLEVHYQPCFAVANGGLHGVEALARWTHPQRGPVSPEVFIPLAEESGLIKELGRRVMRLACQQATQWSGLPSFGVWVNVSGREITPGYADSVLTLLAKEGVPVHRMGIEVTESVLAVEGVAVHELRLLNAAGVAVAVDDFGTGYSSMARLAILPISVLKIDRSFVSAIETPYGRASVDVTVRLASALGVETVAEGVETRVQLETLREAGVDFVSGRLLGKPAPAQPGNPQILTA
jgi:diguanylate cyclase (GGDEF)-like protein/PAS domain S-box-containing protein